PSAARRARPRSERRRRKPELAVNRLFQRCAHAAGCDAFELACHSARRHFVSTKITEHRLDGEKSRDTGARVVAPGGCDSNERGREWIVDRVRRAILITAREIPDPSCNNESQSGD